MIRCLLVLSLSKALSGLVIDYVWLISLQVLFLRFDRA